MSIAVASQPVLVTASAHRPTALRPPPAVHHPPPLCHIRHLRARCSAQRPPSPPVESRRANRFAYFLVSAGVICSRAFLRALPADFPERWRHLREFAEGAEAKVTRLPHHLVQAIMASEDRRFLYHFGVDPWGIGRAVVYYPSGGGGSTITQQLVKNTFLTNERKISRKFIEGILSLILERRMSKWEILYSYLNKMYWGHGKFGIESASLFYFGKHPSNLNVGESALLAGILPSPETLNPFTNLARGKSSQARALRRMVAAGFLDLETALLVVRQPLCLRTGEPGDANQEYEDCRKQKAQNSALRDIWDWEMASITWEATEDMEKWAMLMHKRRR